MIRSPALSTPAYRHHKADIIAAVLGYLAARPCKIPYRLLHQEISDQFDVDEDYLTAEIIGALSALAWAGSIQISTPDDGGFIFGLDTTVEASMAITRFTRLDRGPSPDDEDEPA